MPQSVARLTKDGERFEIIIDPEAAYAYKAGARGFEGVLLAEEVYRDARRGERASPSLLKKVFGTNAVTEIAKRIISEGEVPITTEMRRRLVEEKRAKIINLIARSCIDARTKAPLPPARIEAALAEKSVAIDAFKSAEEQVPGVIEALRDLIPISFEKVVFEARIPASAVYRACGALKMYAQREEWLADGSLLALVEVPAALQAELLERLNKLTGGAMQVREIKREK